GGAHTPEDSRVGLHKPDRTGREPRGGRDHRATRRTGPCGHLLGGHAARAPLRNGRDALRQGGVLPAESVQAEGHPGRHRATLGAVRVKIRGRRIVPGHAAGDVLASPVPCSFVGGADPVAGKILDPSTGVADERLAGRIFAFPHGKGSTVGSYVIYGLAKREVGPAGIVNASAEGIVAVGAILAGIPMVDRIDTAGQCTWSIRSCSTLRVAASAWTGRTSSIAGFAPARNSIAFRRFRA